MTDTTHEQLDEDISLDAPNDAIVAAYTAVAEARDIVDQFGASDWVDELSGEHLPDLESMIGLAGSVAKQLKTIVETLTAIRMDVVTREGGEAWRNGVTWRREAKYKGQTDHAAMRSLALSSIKAVVVDKQTGEKHDVDKPSLAAGWDAAFKTYCAASTAAKVGAIKAFGGRRGDIIDDVLTGHVVVVEADADDGEPL